MFKRAKLAKNRQISGKVETKIKISQIILQNSERLCIFAVET